MTPIFSARWGLSSGDVEADRQQIIPRDGCAPRITSLAEAYWPTSTVRRRLATISAGKGDTDPPDRGYEAEG
jgi:hypothetical protein